jgi:hypothetical protein
MRSRLFTPTAVIDPVFLNLPLAKQVQYEVHPGLHSADPTQIYRSGFGIDVDENRLGVAMSDRVSTVSSCRGAAVIAYRTVCNIADEKG